MTDIATGTLVDSRYEIIEEIGTGGIGTVFKARELGTERIVALKMLHLTLLGDQESRTRFQREGALLSRLDHPNILRCYRFGVWNNRWPYISMEYLDGQALNTLRDMSEPRAVAIARQICAGMDYAHKLRIVHRDLKPANIIVLNQAGIDVIKIVDFGLARVLPGVTKESQRLTQTGALIGSIYYMSPEQCSGKKADERSDIYSLGCILYELISGEPPLVADTPVGLMHLHVNVTPKPLAGSTPGLNSTLMRAMSKKPEQRFQSMQEFRSALDLVAQGKSAEIQEWVQNDSPPKRIAPASLTVVLMLILCSLYISVRTKGPMEDNREGTESIRVGRTMMRMPSTTLPTRTKDDFPSDRMIEAWLKKYGESEQNGRALARYYLLLNNRHTPNARRYFIPAREGLIHLLTESYQKPEMKSQLFRALCDIDPGNQTNHFLRLQGYLPKEFKTELTIDTSHERNNAGDYPGEETILRTVYNTDPFCRALFSRCLLRQGKPFPKEYVTLEAGDYSALQYDYVAKALIELGELNRATIILNERKTRLRPILYADILTKQRKFEACRTMLHEAWSNEDKSSARRALLTRSFIRSYIIAAAIRNSKAEGNTKGKESIEQFVAEASDDPIALTMAAYLCSQDDRQQSERLARSAAKNVPDYDERLLLLLIKTLNVIEKPDLLPLKLKAKLELANPELFLESIRSLRLTGRLNEALSRATILSNLPGLGSGLKLQVLCESAKILLAQGSRDKAVTAADSVLTDLAPARISATAKVQLLEETASIYSKAGNKAKASALLAESSKLIPPRCRQHWNNWDMLDEAWDYQFRTDNSSL